MVLPDVNVWLALTFNSHIHHSAAKIWHGGLSKHPCYFCRSTQQGFLRLATNPKALPTQAVPLGQAWQIYDSILGDPRFAFVAEPAGLEALWRGYTQGQSFSPKVWNDAYLAAFAMAGNLELVTFDKGFSRYQNLQATIL